MDIRKILTFVEDTFAEADRRTDPPLRKVAVVAVVKNPFAGSYVDDLEPLTEASLELGRAHRQIAVSCGNASLSGRELRQGRSGRRRRRAGACGGDADHGLRQRHARGGRWRQGLDLLDDQRVVPAGATIDIPLAHKDALYVRSHYDGITITLHDAPLPDEIAIICAFANRGRLNHRVGGLAAQCHQGS